MTGLVGVQSGRIDVWRLLLAVAMMGVLIDNCVAAPSAQTCAAKKYKAAGRKLYGKAKCHQKALLEPTFPTSDCLAKVEQKFGAAFAKADASGGCVVQNNASEVEAVVDDCLASFTAAITGEAKCAAAKTKAVGRKAYDELNCQRRALLRGTAVDGQCLGKAELRLTMAIAKADEFGTCSDTAAVLETLVDQCMTGLHPGCGNDANSSTCGGTCEPGSVCAGVSGQCGCLPLPSGPCGYSSGTSGTCGGRCDPGSVCTEFGIFGCVCLPCTAFPEACGTCGTSEAPTCDGTCPDGQLCGQASGSNSCTCVSPDNACFISEAPACGGTCQTLACCPAGQVCGQSAVGDGCGCMCPASSLACPFSAKWGTSGSGDGQFDHPSSIAVDSSGNVFVMDNYNYRIQKFTSAGSFLTSWGSAGAGDGQFSAQATIAVDASGNVFVADYWNHRIQKFDGTGTFLTKWGDVTDPIDIAVDAAGNVFVAEFYNGRIRKFTGSGSLIGGWDTGSQPTAIAVDGTGNVFVADNGYNRITKFTNAGTLVSTWGSYGRGIGVDEIGSILVAEVWNDRIQKFDNGGTFVATWGCPGGEDGQFTTPFDVAADGSGNVFVADTGNNRIQKFTCP